MNFERKFELQTSPEEKKNTSLPEKNRTALIFTILRGKEIQNRLPQIAEDYRNGLSLRQIVDKYNIEKEFGLTKQTAIIATSKALGGFKGEMNIPGCPAYSGLIADEIEFSTIGKKHYSDHGTKMGTLMKESRGGFFSLTLEERQQIGSRNGNKNYQAGVGIHKTKTPEEKSRLSKLALQARGVTPLSPEENNLITQLLIEPRYKKGKVTDVAKITQELNNKFHNGSSFRKPDNIKAIIYRLKKKAKEL